MEHRSPKFEKPRLFDPRDSRPTIVKLGFPLMLWLGVFGLYHPPEKPGGLILLGLLALLSLFFFTLALIVPTAGRWSSPKSRAAPGPTTDRKSTRLNSSHLVISYAVFCLKKKKKSP